ncbi:MAG: hypothetical protein IPJ33_13535 [Gammaproteobacteria bacterium]|nr:hypothetical protein [Gammaproteobacteria bacterium]
MKALDIALSGIRMGSPVTLENLTMFPLLGDAVGQPGYLTLEEALQSGLVRVTEVSEQGSVPNLCLVNEAEIPVLLLDGEELVGAKQNRIVNLTIMVAAKSETVIPVSCVEAGRWSRQSDEFSAAGRAHFSRGRAEKTAHINASMGADGTRYSNQSAVWDAIAEKSQRMQARSPTGAAAAMYDDNVVTLERFIAAFSAAELQNGAAFAINGQLIGMDLFDSPVTLAKQLKKLVTSYALDAIDERSDKAVAGTGADCQTLIEAIRRAERSHYRAVGLGEDVRLDSPEINGGSLIVDDRLVHLCAFRMGRAAGRDSAESGPTVLSRASRRRRLH